MKVLPIKSCRACGRNGLHPLLSLGDLCINAFPAPDQPDIPRAPLALAVCDSCHLVQLLHTVSPDALYRTFWYRSGITRTMRAALSSVVEGSTARTSFAQGDTVVDIGSNDSTLLRMWSPGLDRIGFEPATNLMDQARLGGLTVVNDYFTYEGFREVTGKRAKIITAVAMFYDLHDPNTFLSDIYKALSKDGLFVVQMAYLPAMLDTNDVGNICHEHLEYYALGPLVRLFAEHGLAVVDVEFNSVNGGSFRVYAQKGTRDSSEAVQATLRKERSLGLHTLKVYQDFAARAKEIKERVRSLVEEAPKPCHVYGASTKGNTLLQWWELGVGQLPAAAERDEKKWGLETVGTRIPIISEVQSNRLANSYLVLPWHFRAEIEARELSSRAVWIWPLPYPEATRDGVLLTAPPNPW